MTNKTETIKRGYVLKFAEELRPNEVSKLGDRLEFHLSFMAICMGSGRTDTAQDQLGELLKISKAMKEGWDYQI